MIYKVRSDCVLFKLFTGELQSNYVFNDRIKKYCQVYQCNRNDLNIKIDIVKNRPRLVINYKNGEKHKDFDFNDIKTTDLMITPRKYHKTDINRYLTKTCQKKITSPLYYRYFWVIKDLYVEIADVAVPINFKIDGLERVSDEVEKAIYDIYDIVEDNL